MKTVLLVDSDLGFCFWLGHTLDAAGYEAWPARGIPDAIKLLAELSLNVDIAVVNAALPQAGSFIGELRRAHPAAKVIATHNRSEALSPRLGADITCWNGPALDEAAKTRWLQTVRAALSQCAA